ncbi:MAG: hypothetical protein WBK91_04055 [Alphaproteobacteria bacterium]
MARVSKNMPWIKFYPADWQRDNALRSVSYAARGLWLELMCLMHDSEPYGHLLVNGNIPTDMQIATMTGGLPDQIPSLLDELEKAGIFSRTRPGVIYSRRMTRDERKRKQGAEAAQNGTSSSSRRGQQLLDNKEEYLPPPGVVRGVVATPPLAIRDQSLESKNLLSLPSVPDAARGDLSKWRVAQATLDEARTLVPNGWDVEALEQKFVKWVDGKKWPDNFDRAFITWVKNYVRSRKP